MSLVKTIIFGMILMATAAANAECRIVLEKGCKPSKQRTGSAFYDSEAAANANPARCLQRAREYLNYCAVYQQVGAEFYVSGVFTISTYVTPAGSSLWTKSSGGHWLQVQTSY